MLFHNHVFGVGIVHPDSLFGPRVCEYVVCIVSVSYPREAPCLHAFWGVSWFGPESPFTGLGYVVWWFVSVARAFFATC